MSKPNLERTPLPNPIVVGFIFTVLFVIAMVFIVL
ncbi:MAG: DUF2970 domain-containing protein [Methylococcaceae bacterium]|nr:DUF2970 domain-containing protein [Methylococcaceae bacterium]